MRKQHTLAIFLAFTAIFIGAFFAFYAEAASTEKTFGNQPRTVTTFDFGTDMQNPRILVSAVWCFEDGGTPGCFSDSRTVAVGQTGLIFSASKDDGGAGAPGPNCVFYTGNPNAFDYCMDIISSSWDGRRLVIEWEGITDRNINSNFGRPFLTSITVSADPRPATTPPQSSSNGQAIVSLAVSPSVIAPGGSAVLSWASSGATSCTATGGWSGTRPLSGTTVVTPTQTTSYSLVCNSTNAVVSDSKTISVVSTPPVIPGSGNPSVTITATPGTIQPGTTALLSWTSSAVNTCNASGAWSGPKPVAGSEHISPAQTTSYTLSCSGPGGFTTDTETVVVSTQAVVPSTVQVQFSKLSRNVTLGQTSFLSFIEAQGGDMLEFEIKLQNLGNVRGPVTVRDLLPSDLFYITGSTKINGTAAGEGITSTNGMFVGTLNPGETKTILLRAAVMAEAQEKAVANQVLIVAGSMTKTGTATIQIRNRGKVLGAGTVVTGPEDTLLLLAGLGLAGAIGAYFLAFKYRFGKKPLRSLYSDARFTSAVSTLRKKEGFPDTERL